MKYLKKLIIYAILAVIIVGFYYSVSHRNVGDASDKVAIDNQVAKLISRNLDGPYYPEFPRNVVDLYAQITKAYYYTPLDDSQIKALGLQAKKLFDAELAEKNPDDLFIQSLKEDIEKFQKNKIRINDYSVERSSDIETFSFEGQSYAKVTVVYYFYENEGKTRKYIYQDYTLRKAEDGRWGILFWEPADAMEES